MLGVGKGTKLMETHLKGFKRYCATASLGIEMDTLDSTGVVTHTSEWKHVSEERICSELHAFRGHIQQVPPMYSALHHKGKRLYTLAREGVVVEREPRNVEVRELELVSECVSKCVLPSFKLEMETSGGFYVRSLISDLGE